MLKNDMVKVFESTRLMSQTVYYKDTEHLKRNVEVFNDAMSLYNRKGTFFIPDIDFVHGGTVSVALKEKEVTDPDDIRLVAMLNFADAYTPGGLVLSGELTQEENICRCSNLYESLTTDKCYENYYNLNQNQIGHETSSMIYSPDVRVFRDDVTYDLLEDPQYIDVITIPAPIGQFRGVETVLEYRIACMLSAAQYYDVETLVLGAWGCGAFGQSVETVSRCFARMIKRYPTVPRIVFAIRDTYNPEFKGGKLESFKTNFMDEYNK